jgi:hypothetical protein
MKYIDTPFFYESQMVMVAKSNLSLYEQIQAFKILWIERCALPEDYFISENAVFNMYLDLCEKYFPLNNYRLREIFVYASPEKCHEIGYWTSEVNKIWYIRPENHRTEKYDYWTAMVSSILSYVRMLEVKNIPFALPDLEERFKPNTEITYKINN